MNINLTMLGQAISFILFVLFCMKYVWPPLTSIMRERQQAISDGLEKATAAEIKTKFYTHAKALHPDVVSNAPGAQRFNIYIYQYISIYNHSFL